MRSEFVPHRAHAQFKNPIERMNNLPTWLTRVSQDTLAHVKMETEIKHSYLA